MQPKERRSEKTYDKIVAISKAIPWEIKTDIVLDEWKLLQREVDKSDSHKFPIDQYWNQLFEIKDIFGNRSYPTISKIVAYKQCFPFHRKGNSDVERVGCSLLPVGPLLVIEFCSMTERTLNSLLTVKSTFGVYDYEPGAD